MIMQMISVLVLAILITYNTILILNRIDDIEEQLQNKQHNEKARHPQQPTKG
jgi:hypothetical protein